VDKLSVSCGHIDKKVDIGDNDALLSWDVTLGDTLYYINTGTAKSHGDLKLLIK
jgi:hypothetical protein